MEPMTRPDAETPRFVYVAACIVGLGGLLFAYELTVIGGAILFIKEQFALSPDVEEFVVSVVLLGATIGAAVGGPLADRYGRRTTLILTAIIFFLGALGSALAPTVATLIGGRVLAGIGVGTVSVTATLYISEVSPADIRGRLVSLFILIAAFGFLASGLVDYAFSGTHAWRWMFGLAVIPALMFGIGTWFLPESPRWLASHALHDQARAVLTRFRGTPNVDGELQSIQSSLGQHRGGWAQLLSAVVRPALIVGIGVGICQRVTGINLGFFYAPTIFEFAGFESAAVDILASAGLGVTMVLTTIVAMRVVDRVGRRVLMLTGLTGMALSLGALGLAFLVPDRSGILGWVAVLSLMVVVASWTIGPGAVGFMLISEIYPLEIRGMAMSVATVALWAAYLFVTLTFLTTVQILGDAGTFFFYTVMGIGAWLFVYFLAPETKGKSLEEIQAYWAHR
jgi:MFS transporter, SP family, galactose:H+ symporter